MIFDNITTSNVVVFCYLFFYRLAYRSHLPISFSAPFDQCRFLVWPVCSTLWFWCSADYSNQLFAESVAFSSKSSDFWCDSNHSGILYGLDSGKNFQIEIVGLF